MSVYQLSFALEIISADPIARTFVVDWYPEINSLCSPSTDMVADIYLDRYVQAKLLADFLIF